MIPAAGYLREDNWRLTDQSFPVGESLGADTQIVGGPTPSWSCTLEYDVPRRAHLQWEAWIEARRGQLISEQIVPAFGRLTYPAGIPWSGGIHWSGVVGWGATSQPRVTTGANQFARSLAVDDPTNFRIGGFWFLGEAGSSVRYMYRTISVSGNVITFEPGLRAPAITTDRIHWTGSVKMIPAEAIPSFPRTYEAVQRLTLRMSERII